MSLIWLLFAHVVGDFALQGDWMHENKRKHVSMLFVHSLIWTGCICVALEYLQLMTPDKFIFLLIGHFICDLWKCKITKEFLSWAFFVDQTFHLCQCLAVLYFPFNLIG